MTRMEAIHAELKADGTNIEPTVLMRVFKQIAARQQQQARVFRQDCDCTVHSLMALYHKRRGRCELSGIKMTYRPGVREPSSMQIDHIQPVLRIKSIEDVASGRRACGGMVGMMSNIRLVCYAAHKVRHVIDNCGVEFGEMCSRLAAVCEHGPPCDESISVSEACAEKTTQATLDSFVGEILSSCAVPPTVRQVAARAWSAGLVARMATISAAMARMGVAGRHERQCRRVVLAARLLAENNDFVESIGRNVFTPGVRDAYRLALAKANATETTAASVREDLRVAYELVTGSVAPVLHEHQGDASSFVRRKLATWARARSPVAAEVRKVVMSGERMSMSITDVVRHFTVLDEVASVDFGGAYKSLFSVAVSDVIRDLCGLGHAIIHGDTVFSLLTEDQAAEYCGIRADRFSAVVSSGQGPNIHSAGACGQSAPRFTPQDLDCWVSSRALTGRQRTLFLSADSPPITQVTHATRAI